MIVVDTHVIIWDALKPELLSDKASEAIARANQEDGITLCDISLWEIAMLMKKGRVQVDTDYQSFINLVLQANRYLVQSITPEIARQAVQFSKKVNKDPVDRLIAATSAVNNIPLVTADKNLQAADSIKTLW